MPGSSTQFHALRSEMFQLIEESVEEFKLYVVAIRFPPYQAFEISADDLGVKSGKIWVKSGDTIRVYPKLVLCHLPERAFVVKGGLYGFFRL
jgi:hypothetical protein